MQDFFKQKYAHNKKERNFWPQGLKIAVFQQSFFSPMLVETPNFGGVINPKTYLNHELGSKFFSWVVWHINLWIYWFWKKKIMLNEQELIYLFFFWSGT